MSAGLDTEPRTAPAHRSPSPGLEPATFLRLAARGDETARTLPLRHINRQILTSFFFFFSLFFLYLFFFSELLSPAEKISRENNPGRDARVGRRRGEALQGSGAAAARRDAGAAHGGARHGPAGTGMPSARPLRSRLSHRGRATGGGRRGRLPSSAGTASPPPPAPGPAAAAAVARRVPALPGPGLGVGGPPPSPAPGAPQS